MSSGVQRITPLDRDPEPGKVWRYTPADDARLAREVLDATTNGSFVSSFVRVISRGGESKNFRELTGQDGLTCGVGDFASNSGLSSFFRRFAEAFPADFAAAFPDADHRGRLADDAWIARENGGRSSHDNAGLIRYRWIREGVAAMLDDPRHDGWQLAQVVRGKVRPAVDVAAALGVRSAFGVATLAGIANSFGAGGMRSRFAEPARDRFPGDEPAQLAWMLGRYCDDEKDSDGSTRALLRELERALRGETPKLPERALGHRGRRVRELLARFPSTSAPFVGLGVFSLRPEQAWQGDATTAVTS